MNHKPTTEKPPQRRRFLAALGIGSAAAATSVARPARAMTPPDNKGGKHYRESEHVKQYYRVNSY